MHTSTKTTDEIWAPVAGFEGRYEVSTLGSVRSCNYRRTGIPGLLRPGAESNGYLQAVLYRDGVKSRLLVHRLVALAFIPNPEMKPFVNHKDGRKSHNPADNLEWVTRLENAEHSASVLGNDRRKAYVVTDPSGRVFDVVGIERFCAEAGLDQRNMSAVANGHARSHRGWACRYA